MPLFILAGKALFSLVWLVLVWNLIAPFPGNTAYALYAMFAFMLIMHGIQSAIFIRAFASPTTSALGRSGLFSFLACLPYCIFVKNTCKTPDSVFRYHLL